MPNKFPKVQFISKENLGLPTKYPFPYQKEIFTKKEKSVLLRFFTNVDKPVFAIYNLPQEIVGAMFSRYSRSSKSVRRLFLDEFWGGGLINLRVNKQKELDKARERTSNFYKKVFAEFGDDSVIQMGSIHIAFEFVSQLIGAKGIEDQRIASAYIEKSTRYVDFGFKVNNHFLYMIPDELRKFRLKKEYILLNDELFNAYIKFFPIIFDYLKSKFPLEKQFIEDSLTGRNILFSKLNNDEKLQISSAYERALRAKTLDTVRFFLPLSTVTNLGAHFSGQSAELAINKMLSSPYLEVGLLGFLAYKELYKVSPNFLQNIDHRFGEIAREYRKDVRYKMLDVSQKWKKKIKNKPETSWAKLVDYDKDADIKIASQILYTGNNNQLSKKEILNWAKKIKNKEGKIWSPTLIKIINSGVPDRKIKGRNRRQKLPRAFEHSFVEVEFYTDCGTYKDLQRNRMSSTERQNFSANDIYIPIEYKDKGMEEVLSTYLTLAKKIKDLHNKVAKVKNLKFAAEYICILGNKLRFNIRANLRQWVFFAELRTVAGGHPTYRLALQEAARQIIEKMPFMKKYFTHVDWTKDYGLGRLKAEISTQERLSHLK